MGVRSLPYFGPDVARSRATSSTGVTVIVTPSTILPLYTEHYYSLRAID
jgi:hypothetical protein